MTVFMTCGHAHAAVRGGLPDQAFCVGPVDVKVVGVGVDAIALVGSRRGGVVLLDSKSGKAK